MINLSELCETHFDNLLEMHYEYCRSCEEGRRQFEMGYKEYMNTTGHLDCAATILTEITDNFDLGNLIFSLGCGTAGPDLSFQQLMNLVLNTKKRYVGIDSSPIMLLNALMGLQDNEDLHVEPDGLLLSEKHYLNYIRHHSKKIKFYLGDLVSDFAHVVENEGQPSCVIVSYCFHWLNAVELAERVVEDIHKHLAKGGYFLSIEEWPLHVGLGGDEITAYIRKNTKQLNPETELYPLIRKKGFVDAAETICYDIDTLIKLDSHFDIKRHTHVMYGKLFRKV